MTVLSNYDVAWAITDNMCKINEYVPARLKHKLYFIIQKKKETTRAAVNTHTG